jgi:hypothetical protein
MIRVGLLLLMNLWMAARVTIWKPNLCNALSGVLGSLT